MSATTASASWLLVVDDNEDVRTSLAEILRLGGYEVSEASSSDEALALIAEKRFAALVIDLGLERAGLELLDRIADPPAVILMSGLTDASIDDPRVSTFLSKPISPMQLLEEVALCTKSA